jgi:hypothetical protein
VNLADRLWNIRLQLRNNTSSVINGLFYAVVKQRNRDELGRHHPQRGAPDERSQARVQLAVAPAQAWAGVGSSSFFP